MYPRVLGPLLLDMRDHTELAEQVRGHLEEGDLVGPLGLRASNAARASYLWNVRQGNAAIVAIEVPRPFAAGAGAPVYERIGPSSRLWPIF